MKVSWTDLSFPRALYLTSFSHLPLCSPVICLSLNLTSKQANSHGHEAETVLDNTPNKAENASKPSKKDTEFGMSELRFVSRFVLVAPRSRHDHIGTIDASATAFSRSSFVRKRIWGVSTHACRRTCDDSKEFPSPWQTTHKNAHTPIPEWNWRASIIR